MSQKSEGRPFGFLGPAQTFLRRRIVRVLSQDRAKQLFRFERAIDDDQELRGADESGERRRSLGRRCGSSSRSLAGTGGVWDVLGERRKAAPCQAGEPGDEERVTD